MAPESRDEVAQDEVRQRIDSLYDRAENETGNYNATRAMASVTRSRGVPLAKRPRRRPDPALDEIARQWFDGARAKLGPTVPAALPADRLPDRPAAAAGRSRGRTGGASDALGMGVSTRRPEALERATDRVVAELTAGRATDPESLALAARESARVALNGPRRLELPGGQPGLPALDGTGTPGASAAYLALPGAAAPAGPDTRGVPAGLDPVDPAGLGQGEPTGLGLAYPAGLGPAPTADAGPVETAVLPVVGPSAAQGTPVQEPRTLPGPAAPGRPSPATSKANNQRKLAAASDVITRYTARLTTAAATAQAAPMTATPPTPVTAASPMPTTAATSPPVTPAPTAPATAVPPTPPAQATSPTSPWDQPEWTAPTAPATAQPPTPPTQTTSPTPATNPWQQPEWTPPTPPATTQPPTPPTQTTSPTPATNPWQQPEWEAPSAPGAVVTAMPGVEASPATPASGTGAASLVVLPESPRAVRAAKAIAFARAQIGKPCVWGATGPDSYDCSSLTQAAWKAAGVQLPRAAYEQALAGAPVTLAGIEPGDLVLFFDDDRHVGLHVGGGMMVHAPGPGSSIREESIYGAGESAIHRIVRLS
ncbi:NlpC/P60 family protein [Streptomyces sp. NPDC007856]|uniref:NlpC/P60 family protein n=1 Tax=Streptomyces sp. NPDC007856 TaxID=3364781 RepID=UPI003694F5BA